MNFKDTFKKAFHPNRITAYGAGLCMAGVGLVIGGPATDIYGLCLVTLGNGMDFLDGYCARKFKLQTKEGAKIDPLTDKIKNFMVGGYILVNEIMNYNILLPLSMGTNFGVDIANQNQREGDLTEQVEEAYHAIVSPENCKEDNDLDSSIRANYWGKTKAVIQMGVGTGYILRDVLQNHGINLNQTTNEQITYILSATLLTSAVLGGIGLYKKAKIKKEIKESLKTKKELSDLLN